MLGRKPFFGQQIAADRCTLAETGDVVPEAVGSPNRPSEIADDYIARLLADWDGGDRMLKVVWDNGNGAAGDVLEKLVASLPGEHVDTERHHRWTLPGAPPRPDRPGQPGRS